MAQFPPRRPGLPYGGAEERTPLPVPVNERLATLEHHQDRAWEAIEKLAMTTTEIVEVVHGPTGRPDDGMLYKLIGLEKRRRFWDRIAFGVISFIAIALAALVGRIAYMVQAAKLP